jgi:hypothetical protein
MTFPTLFSYAFKFALTPQFLASKFHQFIFFHFICKIITVGVRVNTFRIVIDSIQYD